ncbi:hypothetical protein [Streptomyces antibioticus]|uniref:hypothetical protein n=1 Tax=Streptomyces antibioticus TaxID=1890 RepID=UPI0036FE8EC2
MPALVGKLAAVCPGCREPMDISLRLDQAGDPRPDRLGLVVDTTVVEDHLAAAHPDAQDT